ncbi:unnamed protein product, partial [Phaeothamnion confervicola]
MWSSLSLVADKVNKLKEGLESQMDQAVTQGGPRVASQRDQASSDAASGGASWGLSFAMALPDEFVEEGNLGDSDASSSIDRGGDGEPMDRGKGEPMGCGAAVSMDRRGRSGFDHAVAERGTQQLQEEPDGVSAAVTTSTKLSSAAAREAAKVERREAAERRRRERDIRKLKSKPQDDRGADIDRRDAFIDDSAPAAVRGESPADSAGNAMTETAARDGSARGVTERELSKPSSDSLELGKRAPQARSRSDGSMTNDTALADSVPGSAAATEMTAEAEAAAAETAAADTAAAEMAAAETAAAETVAAETAAAKTAAGAEAAAEETVPAAGAATAAPAAPAAPLPGVSAAAENGVGAIITFSLATAQPETAEPAEPEPPGHALFIPETADAVLDSGFLSLPPEPPEPAVESGITAEDLKAAAESAPQEVAMEADGNLTPSGAVEVETAGAAPSVPPLSPPQPVPLAPLSSVSLVALKTPSNVAADQTMQEEIIGDRGIVPCSSGSSGDGASEEGVVMAAGDSTEAGNCTSTAGGAATTAKGAAAEAGPSQLPLPTVSPPPSMDAAVVEALREENARLEAQLNSSLRTLQQRERQLESMSNALAEANAAAAPADADAAAAAAAAGVAGDRGAASDTAVSVLEAALHKEQDQSRQLARDLRKLESQRDEWASKDKMLQAYADEGRALALKQSEM